LPASPDRIAQVKAGCGGCAILVALPLLAIILFALHTIPDNIAADKQYAKAPICEVAPRPNENCIEVTRGSVTRIDTRTRTEQVGSGKSSRTETITYCVAVVAVEGHPDTEYDTLCSGPPAIGTEVEVRYWMGREVSIAVGGNQVYSNPPSADVGLAIFVAFFAGFALVMLAAFTGIALAVIGTQQKVSRPQAAGPAR
jgi:hypothetical protein